MLLVWVAVQERGTWLASPIKPNWKVHLTQRKHQDLSGNFTLELNRHTVRTRLEGRAIRLPGDGDDSSSGRQQQPVGFSVEAQHALLLGYKPGLCAVKEDCFLRVASIR